VSDKLSIPKPLEQRHRDAMLDLILAWAKIDGSLGWFLSMLHGFDPAEGAILIEDMKPGQIFADARKAIRQMAGGDQAAQKIKKMKLAYENYAPIRNRIAHSFCAGISTENADLIVFLVYSKEGDGLAVEVDHIDTIKRATTYAKALDGYLWEVSNRIEKLRGANTVLTAETAPP
jgi:hypothetical protein